MRFFLGYGLIFFFQHVLTIVGVTAVMLAVNWKLALVAGAITPLIVVLAYRYSKRVAPGAARRPAEDGDMTTVAEENIVGVHVVSRSRRSRPAGGQVRESVGARLQSQHGREPATRDICPGTVVPPARRAGGRDPRRRAHGGRRPAEPDGLLLFNFVVMLVMPLRMLGMWIGQAQRATASGERIFEVLDEVEDAADRPGADGARPRAGPRPVRGRVSFEYADGRPVLEGIDLELEPGKTVALIGHTGSGKTTLAASSRASTT